MHAVDGKLFEAMIMGYGENDERFAREVRDGGSRGAHVRRTSSRREVIDARGSIDSRTFNETHEISSTTKDERDRHAAELDSMSHNSWHSRAGQGFDGPDAGSVRRMAARPVAPRPTSNVGFSGGVMSSGPNYGRPARSALPIVILVLVVLVLIGVIAFLLLH